MVAISLATAGCGPGPGGDAGIDVGPDTLEPIDGSELDGAGDLDAGELVDSGLIEDVGSDLDGGPDDASSDACVPCVTSNPCELVTGCDPACDVMPQPNGTMCPGGVCRDGACTPVPPGCGDAVRVTSGPGREGCDDGNNDPDDACGITCTPTLLIISGPDAPSRASAPIGAADGSGMMLFVWVEQVEATVTGAEPTLEVRAQRFTVSGVRVGTTPFTLEAGIGVGEPLRPSVAGLASGWVVAWRSPTVEGADGELGGVAYRTVPASFGSTLGATRQANAEERLDQRDPRIAALDDGFVIVWTDGSDTVADPGFGVRARRFDALANPIGAELTVPTTTVGDQSQPSLSATATLWTVAWTDTNGGTPIVRARRYDGGTALDAAAIALPSPWAFAPATSRTGDGAWIGWIDRTADSDGDVAIAFLDDTATTATIPSRAATARVEDGVAIAAADSTTAVFGYRTESPLQGLRVDAVGTVAFAPEIADLRARMEGFRQRDLALLSTTTGLWASWSDDSVSDSTAAVAYLLPWD